MAQINSDDLVSEVWRGYELPCLDRSLRTGEVNQQAEKREHNNRGKCNVDSVVCREHEQNPQ